MRIQLSELDLKGYSTSPFSRTPLTHSLKAFPRDASSSKASPILEQRSHHSLSCWQGPGHFALEAEENVMQCDQRKTSCIGRTKTKDGSTLLSIRPDRVLCKVGERWEIILQLPDYQHNSVHQQSGLPSRQRCPHLLRGSSLKS